MLSYCNNCDQVGPCLMKTNMVMPPHCYFCCVMSGIKHLPTHFHMNQVILYESYEILVTLFQAIFRLFSEGILLFITRMIGIIFVRHTLFLFQNLWILFFFELLYIQICHSTFVCYISY